MDQAQESISHYSAELEARRDTSAEDFQRYLDSRGIVLNPQAPRGMLYKWQRTEVSAWDMPVGPALSNFGQTQHMADYVRTHRAAAAKFGQAEHPEREETGFPGLPGLTDQEQQALDQQTK
jgi:hypothetical protein